MIINGYNIKPEADLRGAKLAGANLTDAKLERAKLAYANLTGANLTDAKLERAKLIRAILTGANLTGADLTRANFYRANLREANLTGANLTRANLRGADLRGANLTDANFYRADLRGANFYRANLKGANLTGADLRGATLPPASSLEFCLALNSNIGGAITSVDQLLNLIESGKSNKEESNIYKGHLKWIKDNMEQLIRDNYITDEDKVKIDDYRDLALLAQCNQALNNEITTGSNEGLTGAVRLLFVKGVLESKDQER